MNKPDTLKTKIFLDSGDPDQTRSAQKILGFLDGQTTNPSLIASSPAARERVTSGETFSQQEVYQLYKETVTEMREIMPSGSISIEVYADKETTSEHMIAQGRQMNTWIAGAHIKLPVTAAGLEAATVLVSEGISVNMTLVFSQQQAAAVYAATRGAKKGQVFVSPFIGRLDDRGERGLDLIANILRMYREQGDGHVEVLTASVRSLHHLSSALALGTDCLTAPLAQLEAWKDAGFSLQHEEPDTLTSIIFQSIDLEASIDAFDIYHPLTDVGLERFAHDWNTLIS